VQTILLAILIGALVGGSGVLAWLGLAGRLRQRRMGRLWHELGLKFSAGDPFDVSNRYCQSVLCGAGHSPKAENVAHGRYAGWQLRAFDYRFEVGHGPGRQTRRYTVIVADWDADLPDVLLWNAADAENAPLAARLPCGELGPFLVAHGADFAPALARAFAALEGEPVSIQATRRFLMVWSPATWNPARFRQVVKKVGDALTVLQGCWGSGAALVARP
jgi:hypothetical protein